MVPVKKPRGAIIIEIIKKTGSSKSVPDQHIMAPDIKLCRIDPRAIEIAETPASIKKTLVNFLVSDFAPRTIRGIPRRERIMPGIRKLNIFLKKDQNIEVITKINNKVIMVRMIITEIKIFLFLVTLMLPFTALSA